jgi:HEPN domain-containing protein
MAVEAASDGWYSEPVRAKATDAAGLWLRQASDDYRFGRAALAGAFHAQCCFIAQQVGDKAVKAVHYRLTGRPVIGHSIQALLKALNARAAVTAELIALGGELDQYYVSTRYPDALPGIAPADAFSPAQARSAGKLLRWSRQHLRRRV